MKKIMKHHGGKIAIAAIVALFLGSMVYSHQATSANNEGIVIEDHIKGNPDAEVVLTKYGDFQCPFCAAAYPVVDLVLEEFVDEIRFEYKHLPLSQIHPHAEAAAMAAEAAGQQNMFFEYHDILYDRQSDWSRSAAPAALFVAYAEELNLDMDLFRQHQGASLLRDKVRDETREAFARGYSSTPSFTINGDRINYTGHESLRTQIAQALGQEIEPPNFTPIEE